MHFCMIDKNQSSSDMTQPEKKQNFLERLDYLLSEALRTINNHLLRKLESSYDNDTIPLDNAALLQKNCNKSLRLTQ